MIRVLLLLIGYCFGVFQTGYIYSKKHGVDIRTRGSGNAGSTNVLRVMGLKAGATTFVGDFLKCLIPCLAVRLIFKENTDTMILWTGLGVVLGHDFPAIFNFKGGKGIASSLAIAFVLNWKIGILVVAVWMVIVFITKYVSLASIIAYLVFCIYGCMTYKDAEKIALIIILTGLAIFQHRSNISRLKSGTEHKLNIKRR